MNKRIIGFVLIIASLTAMGIWEFWGRKNLSYEEILVLKEPLGANVIVEEEHFATKMVDSPGKSALRTKDMSSLIGMETAQFVAEGTELRREYFGPTEYKVGEDTGKGIMAISQDWLLSYPQTLMRGDKIAVFRENTKLGECIVAHVRDSSNNEVVFSKEDRENASAAGLYVEVIGDISSLVSISNEASKGTRFTLINLR